MTNGKNGDFKKPFLNIPQEIRDRIKFFKLPGKLMTLNAENVRKENLKPVIEWIAK